MIDALSTTADGLEVTVAGRQLILGWRWLRDHATDEDSYLAATNQRQVGLDTVIAAPPGAATTDGTSLTVSWPAGPTATFDGETLAGLADPVAMYPAAGPGRPAETDTAAPGPGWDAATLADRLVTIGYGTMLTDDGRASAIGGLVGDGIVLVTDVPLDNDATRRVLERFGYIRTTIFGGLWEYSSEPEDDEGYDDTASTPLAITPHTDGTYSNDAPGLLALHCRRYEATGGENVFVDGRTITARLAEQWPEDLELLQTIEIPGQYIGDGAHLVARRPPLRLERGRLVQISFNNHDRAPFLLPEPTMTRLYDALHRLDGLAADPDLSFQLGLRPGDMVIFDNWRLLHGRLALAGSRHMAGGYINREDFDSTVRLHG